MAIVLPIVTQYSGKGLDQAIREVNRAEGSFGKLSAAGGVVKASLAGAAVGLAAFGGYAVLKGLKDSVQAASDLSEAANKSQVIFGDAAREIESFSRSASLELGQSQVQALNAASTFATFGKAAGLAGSELSGFATQLTTLSSDLASFYNTSPEDAITAIGAALRGEAEPIRRYGVLLNDASLKQEYLAQTGTKVTGVLSPQQRVLAAQGLILKQTTDAAGDFERTQGGLANTTRTLTAAVENAQASIGKGLVTAIEDGSEAIGGPKGLAFQIETLGTGLGQVFTLAGKATGSLGGAEEATKNYAYEVNYANDGLRSIVQVLPVFGTFLAVGLGKLEASSQAAYNLGDGYFYAADGMRTYVAAAGYSASMVGKQFSAASKSLGYTPNPYRDYNDYDKTRIDLVGQIIKKQKEAAEAAKKTGSASRGAAAEADTTKWDAASKKLERLKTRYEALNGKLEEATQKLRDYAQAKSDWISGVDLGSAITAQLDDAARRADLDKAIAEAIAAGDAEGKAKAEAQKAGLGAAVSWVDAFTTQIKARKDAATAIDELMKTLNPADTLGNQRLIDQLTTLTPEQAYLAATDLVKKGLGPAIAGELSSLDVWANGTAQTWATTFFQPGVDAAQEAVNGITTKLQAATTALYKEGKKLGKSFMEGFADATAGLPGGVKIPGPQGSLLGAPGAASPIVVNITTGVGNPIAIAREVEAVLNSSSARLGVR